MDEAAEGQVEQGAPGQDGPVRSLEVDPSRLVAKMEARIGALNTDVMMRDTLIDQQQERIMALEAQLLTQGAALAQALSETNGHPETPKRKRAARS